MSNQLTARHVDCISTALWHRWINWWWALQTLMTQCISWHHNTWLQVYIYLIQPKQVAQLSQRDHAAGWASYGQKWKTGTGRQYLPILQVYIPPLWRNWPPKQSDSVKKQKKVITPLKVIEVGTIRKPICDFLLVINSNRQPISYRCRVIAIYCSNFGQFANLRLPLRGLGTMYDGHLGIIGKRVVDFL